MKQCPMYHQHLWIEGPEVPRRYGTALSRLCTNCGVYEIYDWYGGHLNYRWCVDAPAEFEELYENC